MSLFAKNESSSRMPVSIITGFLGSGKTTLLNKLLRHPDMKDTAVAINEFGEVGLDQLFVGVHDGNTIVMDNGCICCTMRGDLEETVLGIYAMGESGEVPAFRRLVIETTGLADPAPILQAMLSNPIISHIFRVDSIVTTVDAVFGDRQLDEHYESVKQAAIADRLVITKSDLADRDATAGLRQRLAALNPGAQIIPVQHGEIEPQRLLGANLFSLGNKSPDVQRWLSEDAYADDHDHHPDSHDHPPDLNRHDERISTFCLTSEQPLQWRSFSRWLSRLKIERSDDLLRVKGILNLVGEPRPVAIHGIHHVCHPPIALDGWPGDDHRSRIVFITRDLPRREVEESWRAFQEGEEA